jgi:hypothetical protein
MTLDLRSIFTAVAACALVYANCDSLSAATIIKLNLGNVTPDLQMNAAGLLGTANDGNNATAGDQDTDVQFTGFLEPAPDITTPIASISLSNLLRTGAADLVTNPGLVTQAFVGGSFGLYDPSNTLLLSGTISTSSLVGTLSPPGAGGVFTTGVVLVTGGVLADLIVPNSLALSLNLTNVNGGNGFSVTGGLVLNPFVTDTSLNISGNPTTIGENFPEPGTLMLAAVAMIAATGFRRRAC